MNEPYNISGSQARVAETGFFAQVYSWMAAGLILSAVAAYGTLTTPFLWRMAISQGFQLGAFLGLIGISIWVSRSLERMSAGAAIAGFLVYAGLLGMCLSPILVIYTGASIAYTFAIAAGTFAFFAVFGYATKTDLTSMGSLFIMGFWGLILASFVNYFLIKSAGFDLIMSYIGIALTMGIIAYYNQTLKHLAQMGVESSDRRTKLAIVGALGLYASFINLFLFLLRLFGRRSD